MGYPDCLSNLIFANSHYVLSNNDLTILFGLKESKLVSINKMIIWLKFFIYRNRCNFVGLSFPLYLKEISFYVKAEYYNARIANRLNIFFSQWEQWLNAFDLNFLLDDNYFVTLNSID